MKIQNEEDVLNPDDTPYDGDPRYVLKRILNKKIEWDEYRTHVSNYGIDKYLPIT